MTGASAVWLATEQSSANADTQAETLEQMLETLRSKIISDIPNLSKVQISFDPNDAKVPLMIVALRV